MDKTSLASSYVPLGFRSYFSLLRGCLSPEKVCQIAREAGYRAVGLTDINNFYGLIRFIKAAHAAQLKPVAGAIIEHNKKSCLTAYVMNKRGYARLCAILTNILTENSPYSRAAFKHTRQQYDYNPIQDLYQNGWQGLCLAADNPGVLQSLLRRQKEGLFVKLTWGVSFIKLVRWARGNGLPLLAVNDIVATEQADCQFFSMLRAIDLNITLEQVPLVERLLPHNFPATAKQMANLFSAVPQAIKNTSLLTDICSTEGIISKSYVFPAFNKLTEGEAFKRLRTLCNSGVYRRYGGWQPQIKKRLEYELNIIRNKHFAGYFLVVHDIVSRCSRTCGRGSSAASIVSYLLGITHIDPLRHNLFFERFLNMGRKDPPDIDVDFPWDERDKALSYVFKRYHDRAGMVADHVTFAHRSCIREPAKALGAKQEEIERFIKYQQLGRFEDIPAYLQHIALRIKGFPRHLGTHPGGVIISPSAITNYTHVQPSLAGYPVIAWEKEATEDAGLVKIDLLGNRSLGVLRDTIALVNKKYGQNIQWEKFNPLQDKATRHLIEKGNTIGIFYIESPATRQLLKKMRIADYEHLVIASSIIRPAANRYIEEFVRRLHGAKYKPLHPAVERTLAETNGIMVYQEDVSRVAIDLAGFSATEADELRKILSKKRGAPALMHYKTRFFAGASRAGAHKNTIEKIWDMILSFDGYSFCKAHSASYALVSYRLAFLKRYFPLEFMASVINNGGGFYSRQTYVHECRRLGFPVLGPDINKSNYLYTAKNKTLRVGLGQLCNIKKPFLEKVLAERDANGRFKDFTDFIRRTNPHLVDLRILIRSGALDSIAGTYTRPQLFWLFLQQDKATGLFGPPPVPAFIGDYAEHIKLSDEIKTLGLLISRHPLEVLKERISIILKQNSLPPHIPSYRIAHFREKEVCLAGLVVTGKQVITKRKKAMMFVSFEDQFSVYETVFFPDIFARFQQLLYESGVFLVCGRVKNIQGALSIEVNGLKTLSRIEN